MLCAAPVSAAPLNDAFANRIPLQLGVADTRANTDATIEPGERLTANDPSGFGCDKQGAAAADGIQMEKTMWWSFSGNGGRITVSTLSSNFDTVLAVYEVGGGDAMLGCNDDLQPVDPSRPTLEYRLASELRLASVAGREYAVQVGACTPASACGAQSGNVTLRVSDTPANDSRAAATPISAGGPRVSSNTGATEDPGEATVCGLSPYGKTVWFRYTAPANGSASFSAAGFDTVLAVYREGSAVPLGCNDDAVKGQTGASRLPAIQPAGQPLEVTPGAYLIQVGGYYDPGFTPVAARNGPLEVEVEFSEDVDLDNDGVDRQHDCNEGDPNVRPGLPEVANNDVDENCDGLKAYDRDQDNYLAPPLGEDCNDQRPGIHPYAKEIPGNKVDENCDDKVAKAKVLESPIGLTASWHGGRDPYAFIEELFVQSLPKRARVSVACRGGGCPFSKRTRRLKVPHPKLLLMHDQRLEVGTTMLVSVTKPHMIGRARLFRVRRGKPIEERSFCLAPEGRYRGCD